MTAHEPNDDAADKGRGTTRRRFLGAAATAAGLAGLTDSSTATSNQPDIDVTHGDHSIVRGELPTRSSNGAFLELYNPNDDDATIRANASHYPDNHEESHASLIVCLDAARLSLNITPEEARTIARDLEAAADVAEGKDV